MKTEIEAMNGQATVFDAQAVDGWTSRDLAAAFRRARQADYAQVQPEAR